MLLDCDILIAGAGPAGCAAAYDLARAGRRVVVLDRRSFPRHKACACGLTRKTLAALRYSVEPVIERVCHEIVLEGRDADGQTDVARVRTKTPICAMAVRERFDAFCLRETLAAGRGGGGVELRKIESLAAVREMADAAGGGVEVDVVTAEGTCTLRASVLLGADGSNGQTRRLAARDCKEPEWYELGFALEAEVPYAELTLPLASGRNADDLVFDFATLAGGYGWLFPKADHINIGVGAFAPSPEAAHPLKAVTRQLLLRYAEQTLGVTALAKITGQALGMGGDRYVPQGRVLLVGDAAGLVDPLTGEGIPSAIVSGQAAAAAVLSGEADVAAAYARRLRPLQQTLAFSRRAARAFYAEPERGLRAVRHPLLRRLILKMYADGLPYPRAISLMAKLAG